MAIRLQIASSGLISSLPLSVSSSSPFLLALHDWHEVVPLHVDWCSSDSVSSSVSSSEDSLEDDDASVDEASDEDDDDSSPSSLQGFVVFVTLVWPLFFLHALWGNL